MKITVLMENTACRDDLFFEHGLSLYIETGQHRILFDAGQSGAFAANAEKLGVDLEKVDFAILSHGHYDHGDGLARFLELNSTAPVYVNRQAFAPHYNAGGKYIGLDRNLPRDRFVLTEDVCEIAPGLTLHTCNGLAWDIEPFGLTFGEDRKPEDFRHEQYLMVEEGEKTVCFSGCSHKGVVNIAGHFRPDVLVGGFHFMKLNDRAKLCQAARALLANPTVYYTGHCTGESQYACMKPILGDRLRPISGGTEVIL